MLISPNRLLIGDKSGMTRKVPQAEAIEAFSETLLSLFRFDWDALNERFSVSGCLTNGQWELVLEPVETENPRMLSSIRLKGDHTFLNTIEINRPTGATLTINLSEQSAHDSLNDSLYATYFKTEAAP